MVYRIEVTCDYQSIDAADVLYAFDECAETIGLQPGDYSQPHQVQAIEAGGDLDLSGQRITEIHGGPIANYRHDFLTGKCRDMSIEQLSLLSDGDVHPALRLEAEFERPPAYSRPGWCLHL